MTINNRRQHSYFSPRQSGSTHFVIILVLALVLGFLFIPRIVEKHALAASFKVFSGTSGYCLDDHDDATANNAAVDTWKCNGSAAQSWAVNYATITHDDKYCLAVKDNSKDLYAQVVLNACNGDPGQVWLRDQRGFVNPNSNLCLSSSASQPGAQLFIDSCSNLSTSPMIWMPSAHNYPTCNGEEGDKVACYAASEWTAWQSGTLSHEDLLNSYTDQAGYEQWCADFVSYVYKEAGYPFTQGETNGWDENIASNIQNMGFSKHSASSGYVPKPGDVAYYDYNGGHVELVISGGKRPTFIYGDSATIDPATGNGQMMANTIISDGAEGQLIYYLSPNH